MPGRIPGVEELLGQVAAKVYVHKAEREFLPGLGSDLVKVDNHDTLEVGRLRLTFLHTPGHTPGSQCFLVDGRLISGDTLFIGSCGRTDLPGQRSERDVLLADPAAGRAARRHDAVPRSQLRRRRPRRSATRSARTRSCASPRSATSCARWAAVGSSRRETRPPVISGREFASGLEHHGFDFFTGVPCSLIEDLIAVLERGRHGPTWPPSARTARSAWPPARGSGAGVPWC